jgi:hypothetical protein
VFRGVCGSAGRVLAGLLVVAVMVGVAPAAWAAKTVSTADYAASVCTAEGPFFAGIAAASNGLQTNGNSTDPTTVRNALNAFADAAGSATTTFRKALGKVGVAKSSAVQRAAVQVAAKLKAIEKLLATTKKDIASLNVSDTNGFGIGLVNVQKDLVKVSNGYSAIGKIKNPKELDRAVKNDPVCQKILVDAAARASGG